MSFGAALRWTGMTSRLTRDRSEMATSQRVTEGADER